MTQEPDNLAILKRLRSLLAHGHTAEASLPDSAIKAIQSEELTRAIRLAIDSFSKLSRAEKELLILPQAALREKIQQNLLNFYSRETSAPYVPLAAAGPWIITVHGGVIYETGGYGMLGFGYNPEFLQQVLSEPMTMSNVMTADFSQQRLVELLNSEVARQQHQSQPDPFYQQYSFMNSGSEAVGVAARIADAYTLQLIESGTVDPERRIKFLGFNNGFHGRTYRAATASDSSLKAYKQLASFRGHDFIDLVRPNCICDLRAAFDQAKAKNIHYEMLLIEPVMGEGRAGYAVTPRFYQEARALCSENNTLLLVDSIQAGMRCQGELSIMNYRDFDGLAAPDFETFSKAVNAGQFPMSVLAMSEKAASAYRPGIYGNTMTCNPRAMSVALATLQQQTPQIKQNIVDLGAYFKAQLLLLKEQLPDICKSVLGTGLLLSLEIDQRYPVVGTNSIEERIRLGGVNVIHGSGNRLRFTPWFKLDKSEVDLIVEVTRKVLRAL